MSRWATGWSRGSNPDKMLSDFLNEGPVDPVRTGNPTGSGALSPGERAKQLGLQSNGKGGYIDPKTGQVVARTINNELVFYSAGPGGGAVSDGSGGAAMARPSSSWQDPITGLMVTPPSQAETPNEIAAIPDPVPSQAPAGYNQFIQQRKLELYSDDAQAREQQNIDAQMGMQPPLPDQAPMGGTSMPEAPMPPLAQENYTPADLLKRTGGMGPPSFSELRDKMKAARKMQQGGYVDGEQQDTNPQKPGKPSLDGLLGQIQGGGQAAPSPAAAPARPVRRDSGNQFTELVTGAVLANPNARSIEDVIGTQIPDGNIARRDGFIADLDNPRNTPEFIQQYAGNLASAINGRFGTIDPNNVFVRANNNDLAPQGILGAIQELSSGEHKADVLFQHGSESNPQYGGIGVKQDHNATLTNYSVESLLEDAFNKKTGLWADPTNPDYDPTWDSNTDYFDPNDPKHIGWGQLLRDAKEGMYREAGLPMNMTELKEAYPKARKKNGDFDWRHPSVPENLRDQYGELYKPDENPYHSKLFELLVANKDDFMGQYYGKLFPKNLPYQLYNWDGTNLEEFSKEGLIGSGQVDLIPSRNHARRGGERAAKGFLTMTHDGLPRMRMEARHKGNPFGSQQLFTHRWNDDKDQFNPL